MFHVPCSMLDGGRIWERQEIVHILNGVDLISKLIIRSTRSPHNLVPLSIHIPIPSRTKHSHIQRAISKANCLIKKDRIIKWPSSYAETARIVMLSILVCKQINKIHLSPYMRCPSVQKKKFVSMCRLFMVSTVLLTFRTKINQTILTTIKACIINENVENLFQLFYRPPILTSLLSQYSSLRHFAVKNCLMNQTFSWLF